MKAATLIFPHQLFKDHPALRIGVPVILVEESLFFTQYLFHKNKLVLHRASMKSYLRFLNQRGYETYYIEAADPRASVAHLINWLATHNCEEIHYAEVVDDWLQRRISQACVEKGIRVIISASPGFLTPMEVANKFFDRKGTYFMASFYIHQRTRLGILVDMKGQPSGGKWSFDADNRRRYPSRSVPPVVQPACKAGELDEALEYVKINFGSNYGSTGAFIYPVNFEQAESWLEAFLEQRFAQFGDYEDAMVSSEHFLHHSVLSPLLNTGLLTPGLVVERALEYAGKHQIALNSLEGFLRQVIGWREFIRIVYERESVKQRSRNFWGFARKIPRSFWTGNTGIDPVDIVIKKVLATGYSHHIERLMVMGNFMLLCEFDPDDVYLWFMEMYIDAYDWVMVPNVYGMTQFADGGLMTTKPYISGSNYLLKMSDFKKGEWSATWDALFWRFMHVHRDVLGKNQRLNMLLKTFDKMNADKRETLLVSAEAFLLNLDSQNMQIGETN